jgi:NADPH2:quinone reductase
MSFRRPSLSAALQTAPSGPRSIRVRAKAADAAALPHAVRAEPASPPTPGPGQALVEVRAAGVNPSDVKAVLGAMPHAVWPRTPGRDYAGVVVDGPAEWIGKEVWGSGGELGIRRDGTHATHLLLDAADLRGKPGTITLAEAGAVGVPFVTAWEGLREAGSVQPGDVVLVLGANGKVGQATIQIAAMAGARVFGVERTPGSYRGHAVGEVTMLSAAGDIAQQVREATSGHGADIVYNTVGSPYFEAANRAMAVRGRQILIATVERAVPFDIFAFYRGQHRYVGLDTLALNSGDCAGILDALRPGFESGTLRPFRVLQANTYGLDQAAAAYQAVLVGAPDRVVLAPGGAG